MPNFISPNLIQQNLSPPQYDEKLKLTKYDVKLTFLYSKDNGVDYTLTYAVQILPKGNKIDPSKPFTVANIDMISLREAILGNIPPSDLKYIILQSFDNIKAIFKFNVDKWMKDATMGIRPMIHISKFDRSFKLKKAPPRVILYEPTRNVFEQFITRKFKDWLESSKKEAKFFKYLVPENQRNKIRTKFRNMFDWSYDSQWNKIIATLKPLYIMALLYATGEVIKGLRASSITRSKKELFSTKVEKNLPKFDRKKWETFVKKKFI